MNHWEENADYPIADWKYEVANDDTRLGYWDWIENREEMNSSDDDE